VKSLGLTGRVVGRVGGEVLTLAGEPALTLAELREAHEGWLPRYMVGAI
jgi:phosphoribosylformylglycinamidine synthase